MTRHLRLPALVLLAALAMVPAGVAFAQSDAAKSGDAADEVTGYAELNASLVDDYAIPHYESLVAAAHAMDDAAGALCAAPSADTMAAARAAFAPLVTAWAGVQHLRMHPQEMEMRAHRLQFWPDRRDQTGRRIARFLHGGDLSVLEPFRFAQSSAVLQGLPAMERMLFDADHAPKIVAGGEDGILRCRLLMAISGNVSGIADAILTEWTREGGFREAILEPDVTTFLFHSHREGALAFFTHFHTAIEYAVESKIADPLGNAEKGPDPHFAEYRRSGLSRESLAAGLASARAMWSGAPYGFRALAEARGAPADVIAQMDEAFAGVDAALAKVPDPLSQTVTTPDGKAAVIDLAERIRALRVLVRSTLAPATGLAVGFNSADGD